MRQRIVFIKIFRESMRGLRKVAYSINTQETEQGLLLVLANKLCLLGIALKRAGISDVAENVFNLLLEISWSPDQDDIVATALGNLGNLYRNRGAFEEAQAAFTKAGELLSGMGDHEKEVVCQMNAALIPLMRGELPEARTALSAILRKCDELGIVEAKIRTANNLAEIALRLNDFESVMTNAFIALEANEMKSDPDDYNLSLELLATSSIFSGKFREGMSHIQSITSATARSKTAASIAERAARRGQHELALSLSEAAVQARGEMSHEICIIMSIAYKNLAQPDLAEELLLEGMRLARKDNDSEAEMMIYVNLLGLYLDQNYHLFNKRNKAFDKLTEAYNRIVNWIPNIRNRELLGILLSNIAFAWHYFGKTVQAIVQRDLKNPVGGLESHFETDGPVSYFETSIDLTQRALAVVTEIHDTEGEAIAENQLAMNFIELGRWYEAETHLERATAIIKAADQRSAEILGRTLYNWARLTRFRGNHKESLAYYKQCSEQIEHLRMSAYSEPFLISIWSEWELMYAEFIPYFIANHLTEEAFFYFESIKARAFLDLLQNTRAGLDAGLQNPENKELLLATSRVERLKESITETLGHPELSRRRTRLEEELRQAEVHKRLSQAVTRRDPPTNPTQQRTKPLRFQEVVDLLRSI